MSSKTFIAEDIPDQLNPVTIMSCGTIFLRSPTVRSHYKLVPSAVRAQDRIIVEARKKTPDQSLRFNQAKIAVISPVDDTDSIGVGIAKDEKLLICFLYLYDGFLRRHRFNRISPRTNDARGRGVGLNRGYRARRYYGGRWCVVFAINDFSFDFYRLPAHFVDGLQGRCIHITRLRFAGQGTIMPVNHNLRDMPVMFFHAQDYMRARCSIEYCDDFFEMDCNVSPDRRRDGEVACCKFDLHPEAPFVSLGASAGKAGNATMD